MKGPDMQEIAKLGSTSAYAPPKPNFDQLLSHDTFPTVGFTNDAGAGRPGAAGNDQLAFANDARAEKAPAAGAHEQNGLQKFMTQALSAAAKVHAALGVDMSSGNKPGSGCPAAGLRNAFSGGGSGNSGSKNG